MKICDILTKFVFHSLKIMLRSHEHQHLNFKESACHVYVISSNKLLHSWGYFSQHLSMPQWSCHEHLQFTHFIIDKVDSSRPLMCFVKVEFLSKFESINPTHIFKLCHFLCALYIKVNFFEIYTSIFDLF